MADGGDSLLYIEPGRTSFIQWVSTLAGKKGCIYRSYLVQCATISQGEQLAIELESRDYWTSIRKEVL